MDTDERPVIPLLEFDESRTAFIEPGDVFTPVDGPTACVLSWFHDGIERVVERLGGHQIASHRWEDGQHPVFEVEFGGQRVALVPMQTILRGHDVPFIAGRTWTTDAFFRETPAKIAARRDEGCLTVEMEAASIAAVAQFRDVRLAQLLYGGDDLSGSTWDHRNWQSQHDVRDNLLDLAMEAALRLADLDAHP